jgi:serine phosphatase RsbU (regulator of sigma subunit)
LLYTDGISDAVGSPGRLFAEGRFLEVIKGNAALPTENFAAKVIDEVQTWRNTDANRSDDLTIVVIDIA